jgi:hypothetical protein
VDLGGRRSGVKEVVGAAVRRGRRGSTPGAGSLTCRDSGAARGGGEVASTGLHTPFLHRSDAFFVGDKICHAQCSV